MRYGVKMETFNERLRNDLELDEGVKYEIYLCSLGKPTFGIGHLVLPTDPESEMEIGNEVSKERVEACFDNDIQVTIEDCKKIFSDWSGLPEEARLVTANMCFQLGRPRLSKFKKTISACNDHRWTDMANEMRDSRWYRQTQNRADRLIKRILDLEG
jgi:lysozyme